MLDLDVCLDKDRATYFKTYRKPISIYDYLPVQSAHRSAVCYGIVHGEMNRLIITNSKRQDFAVQVLFFLKKLRARGYNMIRVADIIQQYPYHMRDKILRERARRLVIKKSCTAAEPNIVSKNLNTVGITVRYARGLDKLRWRRGVTPALRLLEQLQQKEARWSVRYAVGRNLFRQLYKSTWRD